MPAQQELNRQSSPFPLPPLPLPLEELDAPDWCMLAVSSVSPVMLEAVQLWSSSPHAVKTFQHLRH